MEGGRPAQRQREGEGGRGAPKTPEAAEILAVGGGYRAGGNSDILLSSFVRGVESGGATVRPVFLRDLAFTSCIGCEFCADAHRCLRFEDDLTPFYPVIERADGLILASPTYNYNVTALLKAFIDRLYPFYDFTNEHPREYTSALARSPASEGGGPRRAAVLAVCEQVREKDPGFTLEAMARPLAALGFRVDVRLPAYGFFEKGAIRRDRNLLTEAERCGREFSQGGTVE